MTNHISTIESSAQSLAKANIPPFIPTGCSLLDSHLFLALYSLYHAFYTNTLDKSTASKNKRSIINEYTAIVDDTERLYQEYQTEPTLTNANIVINYLFKEIKKI